MTDLERRKKVRVRLRPNLIFSEQSDGARTCCVVKDPVSLRYFRLEERQRFVAEHMDGSRTLEEIQRAYERFFRPERLPLEEMEAFAAQLLRNGLAVNESPLAGRLLFERTEEDRTNAYWSGLLNFLCIKIPLFDPDRFLTRLLPRVRFIFSLGFVLLSLGLVVGAVALLATHWSEFQARLPGLDQFFRFQTLLCIWVALGLVKVLHELGHGLCCKANAGEVHEMGILLLFFFPTLYCDVSDSWMLPSKWKRMAVSAAGIFVELVIAAVATFCWWATDPGTFLNQVCLALMILCSVNTLVFNANPLMRFDGYYLLSDWLDTPNLAEHANRALHTGTMRWFGIELPAQVAWGKQRPGFLACYALASYAYRGMVLVGSFLLLHSLLEPYKLGPLCLILLAVTIAVIVGQPVYRFLQSIKRNGKLPELKPHRLWVSAGILAVIGLAVLVIPLPVNVRGAALIQIEPDQVRRLVIPESGGFVREIFVRDGQRVRAGEVLAVLSNPELEVKLRLNEADQPLREQQKNAQLVQLSDGGISEGQAADDIRQTAFELKSLMRQHALIKEQHDRLTLRAPCDGIVIALRPHQDKGKWLESGTEFCRVGNPRALRAVFLVESADRQLITPGVQAWVRVHGGGSAQCAGVITDVSQVEAKSIPPQLSGRVGGDVLTEHDAVAQTDNPSRQHYLSAARLLRADGIIHPGAMGRVRVEVGSQTLWWRLRRFVASTFG